MQDPIIKHSYVRVNSSVVHLVQYGLSESILKFPTSTTTSQQTSRLSNHDSSLISCSTRSALSSTTLTSSSIISDKSKSLLARLDTTSKKADAKKLIIFVPGNPGILGIYHDFLVSLYKILSSHSRSDKQNQEPPLILAIGHNNFDHPDTGVQYKVQESICLENGDLNFAEKAIATNYSDEPHHIELQILNKLIVLKRLLKATDSEYKLIFTGHSIGCYIILRLLQDRTLSALHHGSVMIHPALENLALTRGGMKFGRMFAYKLDLVAKPIALVLDKLLPRQAKLVLTKWFCSSNYVQNSSDVALDSVAQLVCQKTLHALIQMAKSEFKVVKDLNFDALIKPHISKLKLIYAINDHWVNTDNRKVLRDLYPDLYIEEQARMHAFVMDPQTVMDYAVKVGLFLQDFIDTIDKID